MGVRCYFERFRLIPFISLSEPFMKLCIRCGKELTGKQEKWCSDYCSKYGLKKIYNERVRNRNHEKFLARSKIYSIINKSSIKKPIYCGFCGDIKPLEGHHPDYHHPEFVLFCCRDCHSSIFHPTDGGI